jgi:6-phosphogluconolactonase
MMTALLTSSLLTMSTQATTVYFGTSDSQGIYVAQLDSDKGTLSEPRLAIEIERPGFLTIHPDKNLIYTTTTGSGTDKYGGVAALRINKNGTLALLNKQSSKGKNPCHVSLDASGQCLMVANYGSGSVASFRILEDGSLSESVSFHQHEGSGTHPKRQQAPHAHSIFPNPESTHAYAPDLGIDKVMIYTLDPTSGTLENPSFAEVPGESMGPRHMKWTADGNIAYVLNELDLSISVFKPGKEAGSLEFIKTHTTLPGEMDKEGMTCAEIRIHPNRNYIYASNRDLNNKGRDSISIFTSFEKGFRHVATVPAEVWIPRNFNIDPTGKWLLVGGQKSHDIALFEIDPETGLLSFTGTKIPFEGGPICIEFMD